MVLAQWHPLGLIDEARVEVDEGRERGDEDRDRDQHRHDRERESEQAARRHAECHGGAERQHDREEGAPGPVEEQHDSYQQHGEDRERAGGCRRGLPLQPRGDVRSADLPHRPDASLREPRVDRPERHIALRGSVHVEVHHDRQEAVPHETLPPEERGLEREPLQLGVAGRGSGAPERVEDREGAHVRNAAESRLRGHHPRDGGRRPRILRFEQHEDGLCLREDPLERTGRCVVGIARDDEPVDAALAGDARRPVRGCR